MKWQITNPFSVNLREDNTYRLKQQQSSCPKQGSTAAAAAKSLQLCPTPSDPMDCSPPGPSIHGIFQARVLEWGAIAFSEGSTNSPKKVVRIRGDSSQEWAQWQEIYNTMLAKSLLINLNIWMTNTPYWADQKKESKIFLAWYLLKKLNSSLNVLPK